MSGPLGSSQWMYASGGDFTIDQSLKFDPTKDTYLDRTVTTAATNGKIYTVSCWVKACQAENTRQTIYSTSGGDENEDIVCIYKASSGLSTLRITWENTSGSPAKMSRRSYRMFRDPSAWYHMVFAWDSTQATAANRLKVYVNNELITPWRADISEGYDPTEDEVWRWNADTEHQTVGWGNAASNEFDGYIAEFHNIDGQQLTPSSFGEAGDYGEWKPIEVTGMTYGNNGFYLPFKNDYSVEGFNTVTWGGDSTTSHYIGGVGFQPDLVWIKQRGPGVQDHNLYDSVRNPNKKLKSNETDSEFADTNALTAFNPDGFTVSDDDQVNDTGDTYVAWNWDMGGTGQKSAIYTTGDAVHSTSQSKVPSSSSSIYTPSGNGHYIQIGNKGELDLGSSDFTLEFWVYSGAGYIMSGFDAGHNIYISPSEGVGGVIYISTSDGSLTLAIAPTWSSTWNHIALTRSTNAWAAYVNGTSISTGTRSGSLSSNAFRFGRNGTDGADGSGYFDEIRISDNVRYSGNFTPSTTPFADDANTLVLIHSNQTNGDVRFTNSRGVATNTDGSIASYVRASTTYGQSIVSYNGNGTAGATVGHGLGTVPEMVIVKKRDTTDNWAVHHANAPSSPEDYHYYLDASSAALDNHVQFHDTLPTSSVFTIGDNDQVNNSSGEYVAYCWDSVAGYSKFGSYAGTGGTGNVTTVGFRPAFIMAKKSSDTGGWIMFDTTRQASPDANKTHKYLYADVNNAEYTAGDDAAVTITDTSFQMFGNISATNTNGQTYIYMCFADKREYAYWLDQSGNNNDFTSYNLTESDISLDSPTNNFASFNPLAYRSVNTPDVDWSEGNLKAHLPIYGETYGNFFASTGKWYFELLIHNLAYGLTILLSPSANGTRGIWDPSIGYSNNGQKNIASTYSSYGATYTTGDIIGVAVDFDGDNVIFYKNGATQGTISGSLTDGLAYGLMLSEERSGTHILNCGQDSSFAGNKTAQGNQDGNDIGDFYYTPPANHLAMCTSNLAVPAVIPSEQFQPIDYTGDGNSTQVLTTTFEPDLMWNKTADLHHRLFDRVRGITKQLYPNLTGEEDKYGDFGEVTATSSTSLTFGQGGESGNLINASSADGVFWLWNADSTTSGTTSGSGTGKAYSARYNADAGFSIIKYGGNGTAGHTIPHHLGAVPEMIFVKNLTVSSWDVYHSATGATKNFQLDNESLSTDTTKWNDTAPTTSVFTVGTSAGTNRFTSGDDDQYMAYCFRSVDGYSSIGKYTGNASALGTFIYTGFRPAFVMVKRLTTDEQWYIRDSARDLYNPTGEVIVANGSGHDYNNCASSGNTCMDLLSNGFKQRGTDTSHNSANDFIYIAFAKTPFKYANAQ